jgi:C4-dicarboxylate-specific signal transduction histidine kinase
MTWEEHIMPKMDAGAGSADQIAEVQLRQRLAELAHSSRYSVVGELAASIAHEINQPLGAILANTETLELLLQSPAPDVTELREIAADIRRDSQRAADVIRDLRNFLEKSTVELREVDLSEPVRDAIHFYSALAVPRNTSISSSIAPTPLPVKGNTIQLHQVMMSLIVNAMDAVSDLPVEQRKVLVTTERADNSAKVSVFDSGPGIPPDKLQEIFSPFFSTKGRMGMALPVARTIVKAHGGRIWAENALHGGAVFHVRLPLSAFVPCDVR